MQGNINSTSRPTWSGGARMFAEEGAFRPPERCPPSSSTSLAVFIIPLNFAATDNNLSDVSWRDVRLSGGVMTCK